MSKPDEKLIAGLLETEAASDTAELVAYVLTECSPDLRKRLAEAIYPEGEAMGILDALTEVLFDPKDK